MKIAIIGAGWYGCHLALMLKKEGHDVTIYEKNADIFQQVSGNFGIRLHGGAHYPRSPLTREACLHNFNLFRKHYPELVVDHDYAIYALGELDAGKEPSNVDAEAFRKVCEEFPGSQPINPQQWGYEGMVSAHRMDEPSLLVGEPLRERFRQYLKDANIPVHYNSAVTGIDSKEDGRLDVQINNQEGEHFDKVINATGYQSLLPDSPPPCGVEVSYQPCLGLLYEDKKPQEKPFSLIVMDGLFPCIMPYLHEANGVNSTYLLTHGLYTIMASKPTVADAEEVLSRINDEFIKTQVQPHCEAEINRFWPEFAERFRFIGWKGTVLAKLKTSSEYRSAVTCEKNNIIHVIPGKVSNIFDAEQETKELLNPASPHILEKDGFRYVAGGALDKGKQEIADHPEPHTRHTTNLQTYNHLTGQAFWTTAAPVKSQESISPKPTI